MDCRLGTCVCLYSTRLLFYPIPKEKLMGLAASHNTCTVIAQCSLGLGPVLLVVHVHASNKICGESTKTSHAPAPTVPARNRAAYTVHCIKM